MSNGRLFQTVGPEKVKDLFPKVFQFVVGTRSVKLSEDEWNWREGLYLCSNSDRYPGPPSEREQWHRDETLYWILLGIGSQWNTGLKRNYERIFWLKLPLSGVHSGQQAKDKEAGNSRLCHQVEFVVIIIIIIINPLTARVVGAPQMILQPFSPFFPVLHCPLGLAELQACPFPDVVFPPLPLSALSSCPFHCALQDGFGQTWWDV